MSLDDVVPLGVETPFPETAVVPAEPGTDRVAAERARLQGDAVGGSFWTSVQVVVGLPLATVANVVVAHLLGPGAYGTLAVYTLVLGVLTALMNAGISDATIQWLATHKARDEQGIVTELVRRCSGYHLLVEAPLFAVVVAVLLRDAGWGAMVVGAGSAALVQVLGTSSVAMSGTGLNALAAKIALASTVAGQTTIIAVAVRSPVASSVFAGRLALVLVPTVLAFALVPRTVRAAVVRPLLPRAFPVGFLPYAFRTCASGVVTSLVFGRPELLVFDAYGHVEQAGVFALAAGMAALVTAPVDSLLGPLLPATAGLLAISPDRAGAALLRGLRTSAMLAGLVAAIGIPVLTPLLPVVYGDAYAAATSAFVVLAAVSCLGSVNHPVLAFLLASRRTGLLLGVALVSLVVDAAIAAATIPVLGVAGGVLASSVAQLVTLVVVARRVGELLGVGIAAQLGAMSSVVTAAVAGGAALVAADALGGGSATWRALVGLGVALVVLALLGRAVPGQGLLAADVQVITQGLPRRFAGVFTVLVRWFGLQARER